MLRRDLFARNAELISLASLSEGGGTAKAVTEGVSYQSFTPATFTLPPQILYLLFPHLMVK